MTPYGGLTFFCILALLLIPALVFGLLGRGLRWYGPLMTAALLLVIFPTAQGRLLLLAFWLWQLVLAFLCTRLRPKKPSKAVLWVLALLALLPMIASKVLALLPGLSLSFLGISYMTFRAVDALLDLERKGDKRKAF